MQSIIKKAKLLLLVLVLLTIVGCSSEKKQASDLSDTSSNKKSVNIDFSLFSSENDSFSVLFREWASKIEQQTEGRIKLTPFYSGQLSSLTNTLEAVKNGTVDGGLLSAGAITGQIPSMGLFGTFGTFETEKQFQSVYKEATPLIEQIFKDAGMHLGYWTLGNIYTIHMSPKTLLKDAEQFNGLKIRTAGRWQSEQYKTIGAVPVTMDPSEVYLGLQNGTIDVIGQIPSLTKAFKLYEVAPKMTALKASANSIMYVFNPNVWGQISKEDQQIISKMSEEMAMVSFKFFEEQDMKILKSFTDQGLDIYYLTADEQARILDRMMSITPKVVESAGENGQKLYEILKKY